MGTQVTGGGGWLWRLRQVAGGVAEKLLRQGERVKAKADGLSNGGVFGTKAKVHGQLKALGMPY